MNPRKGAVVIVTFNAMQWIDRCIRSVMESELIVDIIVVDNQSNDGTADHIKKNFPDTQLTQMDYNAGFGVANNIGMRIALEMNCDFVYLLNQDAYLKPDTLSVLDSRAHTSEENWGVLSPIHLDGQGKRLDSKFSFYLNINKNRDLLSDFILEKPRQEVYEVPFVNAAGWYLRTDTLTQVGGFDPIFFMYGEDEQYCRRLRYHGYKIGIVTDCYMLHDRSQESNLPIERYSEKYFNRKRVEFLNAFTRYSNNIEQLYRVTKSKLNRREIHRFVTFRFGDVKHIKKEKDILIKAYDDALISNQTCIRKGPHFLEL